MKFPYVKVPLKERSVITGKMSVDRPIIPIKLFHGKQEVRYEALLDSGADTSIFDAEIGELLGIDVKTGSVWKFGGVQNVKKAAVAYAHTITLSIGGHKYPTRVCFSYDISTSGYGILGQAGFFDLFSICFDLTKERIEIKDKQ
jgi:hypothetical protein